jgi:hypothetical protein
LIKAAFYNNNNNNNNDDDNNKRTLFIRKLDLKFKKETIETLHLEHSFVWCWTLLKIHQKYLESFKYVAGEGYMRRKVGRFV